MTCGNAENHYDPRDLTIDLMTSLKSLGPSLKSSLKSLVPSRKQVPSHLNGDSSLKSRTRVLSSARESNINELLRKAVPDKVLGCSSNIQ